MTVPAFMLPVGNQVHLEAEVADKSVSNFLARYLSITGQQPQHYHVINSANDGKRGLEGRIYFNATPQQVQQLRTNYTVQGPRTKGYLSDRYAYRIDRVSLFWDLISAGYRI